MSAPARAARKSLGDWGFAGPILIGGDPDFDTVRRVWNGMFDRRPLLIARCLGAADVSAALRFAGSAGVEVTVRGGGHNVAGTSVADGALMIDLSLMREVSVDEQACLAYAGGGALLRDVDGATLPAGLVCPSGVVSHTGLGGLALGGGYGWLCRKWGMTCDHIVAAEVVLADGSIVQADDHSHPELMWGLRGGGGNFGVVTRFTLRLRPVGEILLHSMAFGIDDAAAVLGAYRQLGAHTPDDLQVLGTMKYGGGWLPEQIHGRPVISLNAIWLGTPGSESHLIGPLIDSARPVAYRAQSMSFAQLQASADESEPPGRRYFTKSSYLPGFPDAVVEQLAAGARANPSPLSTIDLGHLLGAISAVPMDTTAFPRRDARFMVSASAAWLDPAQDAMNIAWAREMITGLAAYGEGGNYINYMDHAEPGRVAGIYGAHYERLARLKTRVDPGNLLRGNQNIVPARRSSG